MSNNSIISDNLPLPAKTFPTWQSFFQNYNDTMQIEHKKQPTSQADPWETADTALLTKKQTKRPSLYKVLLHNDDFTPMDFVVQILTRFFHKSRQEATAIMLTVHHTGVGVCGVYTFEVAETKVSQVLDFGRVHQHPLQCTMEKE